jgi:serine/threonine protein kinase
LEGPSPDDGSDRRAAARVGECLNGRWRLDSLIGVGGTASVYAATHRNGKRVAVKVLHDELAGDADFRRRFIDEGYVANRVHHAGTASVLDDGETPDGLVFLVMDLLEGQTLDERLRTHILPLAELLAIIAELLDVLASAHDAGVVHRDIKPGNIFITHEGTVRLLDFGIASMKTRPRATKQGVTMGTPVFMPPEQARGHWEQVDGRTDLWAVGATLFAALTGRPIHSGNTANEELLSAMTRRAPSLADVVPGMPKALVDFVDRAVAFEKIDRWPNARVMRTALRAVQSAIESPPVATASTAEGSRAVGVVRHSVWLPRASLVGRAMWVATTRSWYVLPAEPGLDASSTASTAPKREPGR